LGVVGFSSSAFAIFLSLIPPPEETHKFLYFCKLLGSTGALIAVGLVLFHMGRRSR
jgi:hypothetical protein